MGSCASPRSLLGFFAGLASRRGLVLLRTPEHVVVRRWLVVEVVRLHVIAAHGVVLEAIPHQQPPQVRMSRKDDPIEVEDLPLLKLRGAPDGRQRRQLDVFGSVDSPHPQNHRPVLLSHRIEVIDGLQAARLETPPRLFDSLLDRLFHTFHSLQDLTRNFNFLRDLFVGPIDTRDVGEEVKRELGVIASLTIGSMPAIKAFGLNFVFTQDWNPVNEKFGALASIYGTLITSFLALLMAVFLLACGSSSKNAEVTDGDTDSNSDVTDGDSDSEAASEPSESPAWT